jgi:hypothetical protein
MNYNAYDVVETIYETFARVFASRCFCVADRLRGRTASAPDPPSFSLSGGDAFALSAAAAALRPKRWPAASGFEYTARACATANRSDSEQTDQG